MAENKNISLLKIRVLTANDAIPIEGAEVVIEKDGTVEAFMLTDDSGSTPFIKLPSPSRDKSLDPYYGEKGYFYSGNIYADGFYPQKNLYIELIGGTSSTLKVNMIPIYRK